jgi:hypothetical protein
VNIVCCQVEVSARGQSLVQRNRTECGVSECDLEVSARGQSLVQRNRTECGVSECDLETSTMQRPRPTGAVQP